MPIISQRYDPAQGPIIQVLFAPPNTVKSTPKPTLYGCNALIDTGASKTCITRPMADKLGISPIGMAKMQSATGHEAQNLYLVDAVLSFGQLQYGLDAIQVMEFAELVGGPFECLLGRDVICRGALTIQFDGRFTFAL